jgi:P-type Cu2+ transporter
MTETDRQGRDLLMRLGVAGFAMMNIMLLSVAVWSGATDATRDLFHLISALIAIPTVAFSGQPFFRSAARALRAGRLGMDGPISLALVLTVVISLYETLQSGEHAYFEAAVMLTFFLLAGRYLDFRARAAARSAAQELAALEVPRATRLIDGARGDGAGGGAGAWAIWCWCARRAGAGGRHRHRRPVRDRPLAPDRRDAARLRRRGHRSAPARST